KDSISSEWVKNEAAVASERGALVPALIDGVEPPLEFRRKQTADLIGWDGDPSHGGFQALCDGVAATTKISGIAPHQSPTRPVLGFYWNRRWTLGAITAIAVALGFGACRGLVVAPEQGGLSRREDIVVQQSSPQVKTVPTEAHGVNNPLSVNLGA